jgi:SAM-dependent methyltransferase
VSQPELAASPTLVWTDRRPIALNRAEQSLERMIALAYSVAYDAVVTGFAPFEALVGEVTDVLARAENGRALCVLDVACGTGTVARRLAQAGHTVVGVDPIASLVERAQLRGGTRVGFARADLADGTRFAEGTFDACVSMHTLNWHPRPVALLAECRRLLRPGGHAVILAYSRPAAVSATFRDVYAREGLRPALAALRWLVPTAVFEACRHYTPRYPDAETLHREITAAGFEIRASRPAFLAGVSRLVWARAVSH